jgi:predicted O-methyltransferase YrrM
MMSTSFATRVALKIKKIARELSETPPEREFRRKWPELDSIEGWLLPSEGKWLFNAARFLPSRANIVEIGSYKGRSTCCLSLGCRENSARVFAIDSFDGGPNLPKADSLPDFNANVKRFGLMEFVEPITAYSFEAAKSWNKPIHFLFIDGSHLYEDVLADFAGFFAHVVPGGIVALHDVINESWPGVGQAWHGSIKGQLKETGACDSLAFGRKP